MLKYVYEQETGERRGKKGKREREREREEEEKEYGEKERECVCVFMGVYKGDYKKSCIEKRTRFEMGE